MAELREYGTATTIYFPLIDRGTLDFESTPVTFAAGDTQFSEDGAAFANTTNNPAHEGNGIYSLALTATEMEGANVTVTIIDQTATKLWEDQAIIIETYGDASAEHAVNINDTVRAGLTALPNAAAEAAGGLYTRGTGAGQINQDANGRIDANEVTVGGTTQTANDNGADINAILTDTNELQTDWANGGRLDLILDARAAEATVTALNDISAADVNTQVLDVVNTDTFSEPAQGAPAASQTITNMIYYLYAALRNRVVVDESGSPLQTRFYADDGTTILWEKDHTDASSVLDQSEGQTGA